MKLLSVVLPMYNSEKYADVCIKNILSQSFKDYELIIIDDGSSDSTGLICEQFKYDSRVKYFYQPNGGSHKARNLGIKKSTGELITFVDSDDIIPSNYFEVLVNLYKNDIDCVFCDIYHQKHEGLVKNSFFKKEFVSLDTRKKITYMLSDDSFPAPYAKLFNLSKIRNLGHQFLECDNYFGFAEDFYFNSIYLINSEKLLYTNRTYYIYNKLNENSQCNNPSLDVQRRNNVDRAIVIYSILQYMFQNKLNINKYNAIFYMIRKHLDWGGSVTKDTLLNLLRHSNLPKSYMKKVFSFSLGIYLFDFFNK
ncbi:MULTISPECIES: glycosyltransferase family 2 protein [unclassified Gilliamella]|uniref:glycosyltransferase family 2 protein n=1 Tax=unclassified Gilliamella TaxID=2685620 RepID=UPI0018DB9634|nr:MULTISPECIES: glycosyltransferase family 2 protein [unclassified Gilliamella]MBI0029123.1 glycosyltransferase family 2 protein [Gilliamella sp. B14448G7]MBI0030837.1 glycosyltransferase family 2 protein [Gilliamella sp. B14384G15]MBI0036021.1 glycosyltransferase family 2 protein [Gilliamella sp. B14448G11]MBI0043318.1 glycosyltransferase family 2 protein [Gilliamella sp. B14448G12]MBI0058178.1 glycosyltransferase family 2 protein [Gilliamella sp. B14384G12]